MRKVIKYPQVLSAVLLLLLVACARYLTMNQIQFIEQGMSPSSLSSMLGHMPAKVFTVVDPDSGLEYQVQIFPMQTGIAGSHSSIYSEGVLISWYNSHPVSDDFAFLFREDSLRFWGFLHEYARSDDMIIRRLAPIIIEGLEGEEGNETE